ncbi:IS66 family transposase [Massilia atriviolacea]|uniref:IS66 family transposase n=1 Tax=Massilia atriviolacea TaxID=2495579 RepID=A0A430HKM5_9BURK|nr:transposase [Massilia atriviolacea]RSZ58063.1 hypothetical protein EJB06_17365 [Massilia atriviolacea]
MRLLPWRPAPHGEEISEQLDIIPATVQVLQHVRFKYGCRHCDRHAEASTIITSPMPAQPMPGSIASASTLATVLTAKYVDGTPMYRMHAALLRGEVEVARTTLSQWAIKAGVMATPLYEAMRQVLRQCPVIHGDETRVQVLKEDGRSAQSQSYMWACGIEPYAYLRHILTELPCRQAGADVTDLLPFNFKKN